MKAIGQKRICFEVEIIAVAKDDSNRNKGPAYSI
jgi:hypothetical protein